ncbi:kinase-like domain-containing protein [Hyaloscypha sp. PMI_1271]|nr:kinase-like domain-containing protein [Hyaloscypha sp. PMI_1271]
MAGARTQNHGSPQLASIRELKGFLESDHVLLRSVISNQHFVCIPEVKKYLGERNCKRLKELLNALYKENGCNKPDCDDVLRNYTSILCILIAIDKPHRIHKFVRYNEFNDEHLPFTSKPGNFPTDKGRTDFWLEFEENQWRFCAVLFKDRMKKKISSHKRILPITAMKILNTGGSGTVSKIGIHACYNLLRGEHPPHGNSTTDMCSEPSNTYALKTYHPSERESYKCETKAYKTLSENPKLPLITTFYCDFEQEKDPKDQTENEDEKCNSYVIVEYADRGNLEEFFQKTKPPSELQDIVNFWKHFCEIAKALYSVHTITPQTGDHSEEQAGWHYDVKPENILVFSNGRSSDYECCFKLTDFGISLFKATDGKRGEPMAVDGCGTIMYGPPECFRFRERWLNTSAQTSQGVDIWSFGCILSEAVVWMGMGYAGLEKYRTARNSHPSRSEEDYMELSSCFHDGIKKIDTVDEWHKKAIGSLQVADELIRKIVEKFESCFIDEARLRCKADMLDFMLSKARVEYEQRKLGISPQLSSLDTLDRSQSTLLKSHLSEAEIRLGQRDTKGAFEELEAAKEIWDKFFVKHTKELLEYDLKICTAYAKHSRQIIENQSTPEEKKSRFIKNAEYYESEAIVIRNYLSPEAR